MSSLDSLPEEVLSLVAVNAGAFPGSLWSLLLSCKRLAGELHIEANPRLYASLFLQTFDIEAPVRRFGSASLSATVLANEYRKRKGMLRRIRSTKNQEDVNEWPGGPEQRTRDLWTSYLMMLESDALNRFALMAAGLADVVDLFLETSLGAGRRNYTWETVDRSLALHLQYLLLDEARLRACSIGRRELQFEAIRPFVMAAHRFAAHHAPWPLAQLPLTMSKETALNQFGPTYDHFDLSGRTSMDIETVEHFGQNLQLACPFISHAAILSFFVRLQFVGRAITNLTLADFEDITQSEVARREGSAPLASRRSADYDIDFKRMALCLNPFSCRGIPRSSFRGIIEGEWEGPFAFFDFDRYGQMLSDRLTDIYSVPFGDQRQRWTLQERRVRITPSLREEAVLQDVEGIETLFDGHRSWIDLSPEDADDDLTEIVVTGEGASPWGQFMLKGRLRPYDGLLTVVKEYPTLGRGQWLYRGYLTRGNTRMVGRWRDCFTGTMAPAFEGPFCVTKTREGCSAQS